MSISTLELTFSVLVKVEVVCLAYGYLRYLKVADTCFIHTYNNTHTYVCVYGHTNALILLKLINDK